jgi:hypothetical protein
MYSKRKRSHGRQAFLLNIPAMLHKAITMTASKFAKCASFDVSYTQYPRKVDTCPQSPALTRPRMSLCFVHCRKGGCFSHTAADAVMARTARAGGEQLSVCGDLGPLVELLSATGAWLHQLQVINISRE